MRTPLACSSRGAPGQAAQTIVTGRPWAARPAATRSTNRSEPPPSGLRVTRQFRKTTPPRPGSLPSTAASGGRGGRGVAVIGAANLSHSAPTRLQPDDLAQVRGVRPVRAALPTCIAIPGRSCKWSLQAWLQRLYNPERYRPVPEQALEGQGGSRGSSRVCPRGPGQRTGPSPAGGADAVPGT